VIAGVGAAGVAISKILLEAGVAEIVGVDRKGAIWEGREDLNPAKQWFAENTNRDKRTGSLAQVMPGADVFIGVSGPGLVTADDLRTMGSDPIVFALANPDPEISYPDAVAARPDVIMATGRSDYPNQVNNVLGFPFIFRGALDVRAKAVSEKMKIAAVHALADLAREPVPDSVLRAYDLDRLQFGPEYLIPKPFDPRVLWRVAPAVARAAMEEGLARAPITDFDEYIAQLQTRFNASYELINAITARAMEQPKKIVYPHAEDVRMIRAARRVTDEGIGSVVLLGDAERIQGMAEEAGLSIDGIEVVDHIKEEAERDRYALILEQLRRHKGLSLLDARKQTEDPAMYACLMVREGTADAVIGGLSSYYPETIRPALQVLQVEEGRSIVSSVYLVVVRGTAFFFTDCAVNIEPTAEQLAEIALAATTTAEEDFSRSPRVAFISYSDFGSAGGSEPARVRRAVELFRLARPDVPVDGEMQADTAVMPDLLIDRRPKGPLGRAANVLVFPNLTAANASYKLLNRLGDAEVIGPILSGLSKTVHVMQRDASVNDVVNMTAIAVAEAQRRERASGSA
jgi:malate dehydrogenase (oxaloacetate-decarboxylating)(NADP+)